MKDIVIIGAGGLGREVAWLIEDINEYEKKWNILGFVDDNVEKGKAINGYEVLGNNSFFNKVKSIYYICAIANTKNRKHIVKMVSKDPKNKAATLIHPSVNIAHNTTDLKEGCIICAGSIISTNTKIGMFNIIDWNCTIGHDVVFKNFITLYPSVNVSGNCNIGNCVELGTGSKVIQGKSIGKNSIIGAGAIVINNIKSNVTAVGVPAKVIKINEDLN